MIKKTILSFKKIHEVASMLPGANCTSCGADDCKDFARMIILHKADVGRCVMCDAAMRGRIREYLRHRGTSGNDPF